MRREKKQLLVVALIALGIVGQFALELPAQAVTGWWTPGLEVSWQIQLSGNPDIAIAADAYDVDLDETPQAKIDELHNRGTKVICYFSAGSAETFRDDYDQFQGHLGKILDGWEEER